MLLIEDKCKNFIAFNHLDNLSIVYSLVKIMDGFFAKKGITLSRNQQYHVQPKRQELLRTHQQINRTLPPQITLINRNPPQRNYPVETANTKLFQQTELSYNPPFQPNQEKSFSLENHQRSAIHPTFVQVQPQPPKHSQWKYIPTFLNKTRGFAGPQNADKQQNIKENINSTMFTGSMNQSFEEMKQSRDKIISEPLYQTEKKSQSRLKSYLQSLKSQEDHLNYIKVSPTKLQKSSSIGQHSLSKQQTFLKHEQCQLRQRQKDSKIKQLEQQKQYLKQLHLQNNNKIANDAEERFALLKEANQKALRISEMENQLAGQQRSHQQTVRMLQSQIVSLEASRDGLLKQIQTSQQLLRSEKQKNEKSLDQMHKLIFFEQDLVHAKDYDRLKRQVESVLTQNAKMFQEHQQYIIEVGQNRRKFQSIIEQLEDSIRQLREQLNQNRLKIQRLDCCGDDKMLIIKLQNEINFLKKKNEDQIELVLSREKQLEEAKIELQQILKQQRNDNSSKLDEFNLVQIKDTIAIYQSRIIDINEELNKKQMQVDRQKKTIEALTTQLRKNREDKHICSKKDKSQENNLKNQVQTLQRSLQSEVQISNKKIFNLEEALQRKTKQIGQKDKFIKEFLIGRAKKLDTVSLEEIMASIKEYFCPLNSHPIVENL